MRSERYISEVVDNATQSATRDEFHAELLRGLQALVGCDSAAIRPGGRWTGGAPAYFLNEDQAFTDEYTRRSDFYRPDITTWCQLSHGDRAVIDTDVYSTTERRAKAFYADLVFPENINGVMGCPLSINGEVVALILLFRRGLDRPFTSDHARMLDPMLKSLALAEKAILSQAQDEYRGAQTLPKHLDDVLRQLLTGKTERAIAQALELSPRTVHKYTEKIYRRFRVKSRAELMACFMTQRGG